MSEVQVVLRAGVQLSHHSRKMKGQKDIDRQTTFLPQSFALTSHQLFNVKKESRTYEEMETGAMNTERLCAMRGLVSMLLLLAGCASATPVTKSSQPHDERSAMQRPVRVIISFQN